MIITRLCVDKWKWLYTDLNFPCVLFHLTKGCDAFLTVTSSKLYRMRDFRKVDCFLRYLCEVDSEFPAVMSGMGSSLFLCFNSNMFSWRRNVFERHIFLIKCRGMTGNVLWDTFWDYRVFSFLSSNCLYYSFCEYSVGKRVVSPAEHLGSAVCRGKCTGSSVLLLDKLCTAK